MMLMMTKMIVSVVTVYNSDDYFNYNDHDSNVHQPGIYQVFITLCMDIRKLPHVCVCVRVRVCLWTCVCVYVCGRGVCKKMEH